MPAAKKKDEDSYTPPRQAWNLIDFIKATPKELKEKTVDCGTCPVALLCTAGSGGTGYVCQRCKSTSVWCIDSEHTRDILVLDCAKHRFHEDKSRPDKRDPQCPLCDDRAIKYVVDGQPPFQHYVYTKHSMYQATERQERFKEAEGKWRKHNAHVAEMKAQRLKK